jgi:hypothetical protein
MTVETLTPLAILFVLFALFAYVLYRAQANPSINFDLANFLKDDSGKESSGRLFGFVALAVHSWWVATLVLQKTATENHFLYYGLIWAGTPAIMIFAQRWSGNLPLASAQPTTPTKD